MRNRASILVLLLLVGPLFADSLSSIADKKYHRLTNPLTASIDAHIDRIVYPTIGFPSIVSHRDTIPIHFQMPEQAGVVFVVRLVRTVGPVANVETIPVHSTSYESDWGGYRIVAEVLSTVPEGMYDLEVEAIGPGLSDIQPNAVKVLASIPRKFRFLHIADSQHGDPRGLINPANHNAGNYDPASILAQEIEEIRYIDPAFTVLSGDLLFGMEYSAEYEGAWQQWRNAGFPVFMVPGNHDGYATTQHYKYKFLQVTPRDGLEFWRRIFGPLDYSFDFGPYHFVALNSYDGSAERRDSFFIVNRNYGGHFTRFQLDWLKSDLATATAAGKQTIVFMHHNPRGRVGKPEGPYTPNRPFRLSDLGEDIEQALIQQDLESLIDKWEDGQDWNDEASGKEFLDLVQANSVSHVLIGHVHRDGLSQVGNVQFIQTTTLSSSSKKGYWGYRLFEVDGPNITRVDYEGTSRQSIPAGNLVFDSHDNDGEHDRSRIYVRNGLSRAVDGRLTFNVRRSDNGYQVNGGTLIDVVDVGGSAIVTVETDAPAGASLTSPSTTAVEVVSLSPAATPAPGCNSLPPGVSPPEGDGPAAFGFLFWVVLVPVAVWFTGRRRRLARAA